MYEAREDCVEWGSRGENYRGNVSQTTSGRTCQFWSKQTPHQHRHYTEENIEKYGVGDHNFCRNPVPELPASERPWCYTTDKSKKWEFCNVPVCGGVPVIELRGGASNSSGSVFINNLPLCHTYWTLHTADLVCRHLGYPGGAVAATSHIRQEQYSLGHFLCNLSTTNISQCGHRSESCDGDAGAGVICDGRGNIIISQLKI